MMLTPFPLGLDSPGKRVHVSTLQTRSAALLMSILGEHHMRGHRRYARRDVTGDGKSETFCNLFTQDVAEAMGVLLPRNMRANELIIWLQTFGLANGWQQINEHVGKAMASEGQLAVAVWYNRNGGPGHIAPLAPPLNETPAMISNVGGLNFLYGTITQGFAGLTPTFFGHP